MWSSSNSRGLALQMFYYFGVATITCSSYSASPATRHNRACEMLIAVDEPLFRYQNQSLDRIKSLAMTHVRELNRIYHKTFLIGHDFGHLYFRIKEVRVLFDFCANCNHTHEVFLKEFTRLDTSDFCLAHLFTFRDFPGGLQGLAWKGTLCRKDFNTGFTTLLNHEVSSTLQQSGMTFSHEVGHNFGSDHDEDEPGCPPDHIMSSQGSKGSHVKFSGCSLRNMTSKLHNVLNNVSAINRNCFVQKDYVENDNNFAVCGDGQVFPGVEECDCGVDYTQCDDPCCYPAHISPWDTWMNKSAVPCRRNAKIACVDPFRSLVNYGLIAPWIFIGSSTLVIGIWLFVVRKFGLCHIAKRQTAVGAKQREACLRETAFVTVKSPSSPVKIKPAFHNRQLPSVRDRPTMLPTPSIHQWQTSPLKRPLERPPSPPPPPLKSTLDRHFSEVRDNHLVGQQNVSADRSLPPVVGQMPSRINDSRHLPVDQVPSSRLPDLSPLDKPLPPLPQTDGSVYLTAVAPDIDFVPRRRAPAPPPESSTVGDDDQSSSSQEPLTGNVSKLKGIFEN